MARYLVVFLGRATAGCLLVMACLSSVQPCAGQDDFFFEIPAEPEAAVAAEEPENVDIEPPAVEEPREAAPEPKPADETIGDDFFGTDLSPVEQDKTDVMVPTDATPAAVPAEDVGDVERAVEGMMTEQPPPGRTPAVGGVDDSAAPAARRVEPTPEELDVNERIRRQELKLVADELVMQALRAYRKGDYAEAIGLYQTADARLAKISRSEPSILNTRQRINEMIFNIYVDWAEEIAAEARRYANAEKFDEAQDKAESAADLNPKRREEMDQLRKRFQEMKKQAEYEVQIRPEYVDVRKVEREFDLSVLLEQGRVFLENNQLTEARDKFEEILIRDPYNVNAMRELRKISKKLVDVSEERRKVTIMDRIAEVRWKWNEPVPSQDVGLPGDLGGRRVEKEPESGIYSKLKNITIDKIGFENASIEDVVTYLKRRSVLQDPDGIGVNIILQLAQVDGAAVAPAPSAPADDFGDFGAFGDDFGGGDGFGAPAAGAAPAATSAPQSRRITMELDSIPLGEAIRYICMSAGLRYKVEENVVIIADPSVPLDDLETKFYAVEAGVLDTSATMRRGDIAGNIFGETADTADDDDATSTRGTFGLSTTGLQEFFENFGITFPRGAKIAYYGRAGQLVVHNTPDNLRKIEQVLRKINVTPKQVTIEAKFVEVVQNDIFEIGFEWLLAEGDGNFNDGIIIGGGKNKAQILKQGSPESGAIFAPRLSNALRFAHQVFEDVPDGSDEILSINSILGNVSFNTIIHALSQRTNADVLSAPKVTTLSGNTAILRMVEQRNIATGWTEPQLESNETGTSFTPSIAETETRDFGVILEVTPTVAADEYSIALDLAPTVEQFVRYDDSFNYTMVVDGREVEAKQLTPIVSERSVQTKVIVWDGETVVLGGMIGERVAKWEDKIPLLGDLPLIGMFFRTDGEKSEKTNLLIFVTARLVNPAGIPIRANEVRGLPDFRR